MSIEEYELSDREYSGASASEINGCVFISCCDGVYLSKKDIIALAKHFNLTADDINNVL